MKKLKAHFPELTAFVAIYLFLLAYCTPDLIFSTTMLTGGDSASWLQPVEHLRNVLLPNGRVFGWSLSNFFGYNEGQYYFPLPFVTGALLSYLIPTTIALKLVTLAGLFALPAAFYFTARRMFANRWVQLAAPAVSLIFLCNESYTMYGGNFLSTFAGEFCYSWAVAFFVMFLGSLWKTLTKGTNPVAAGVLLALVSLSHTFIFMVAFLMPMFFVFTRKDRAETSKLVFRLGVIYLVGLAGSAFWLLPMVMTRVWAATIPMFWEFATVVDFLQQTQFLVVALAAALLGIGMRIPGQRRMAAFLLFGFVMCAFLFVSSSFLEVPDIRFVPPALLLAVLAFLFFAQDLVDRKQPKKTSWTPPPPWVSLLIVYAACFTAAFFEARNLSNWFRWNYQGYEARKEAPVLAKLTRQFSGDSASGRFLWEKPDQRDSADFGSERVFENLFHFTGRGTSEGIHYGSSFMARASTYLQSEYSRNPVDPEPNRLYSVVNPEVWPLRFRQLNAREIIVFSDKIKQLFAAQPEFEKTADYGKFQVFTFKNFAARYTEVLPEGALSLVTPSSGGFKTDLYRYFRDYELIGHPFVPASFADAPLKALVPSAGSYDQLLARYQSGQDYKTWRPNTTPITEEAVTDLTIRFTTTEIGKPHLIKVTYSPQFRSVGGETIYPVAPGFLLLYPKSNQVEIRFERNPWELAGGLLTLLVFPFGFWVGRRPDRKFPLPRTFQAVALAVFGFGVVAFLVLSLGGTRQVMADYRAASGLAFHSPEANDKALALLGPLTSPALIERYDNKLNADALLLKARLLKAKGLVEQAKAAYQTLATRFAHSRVVQELQKELSAAGVRMERVGNVIQ